jgi:hypothetical protein
MSTSRAVALARLVLCVSPLMLAHCSSAATKITPAGDGGGSGNGSSGGLSGLSGGSSGSGSSSGAGGDDGGGVDPFGGDDSGLAPTSDDGAAGDAAVAPGSDAATASGSSSGGSSSGGGSTCAAPSGGLACDPGQVTCGGGTCSTGSQFCCISNADDGGLSSTCNAYNSATCPSGALSIGCDEAADCSNGVCCEQIIGLGVAGPTQCMASCPSGYFQVCKSDTECPSSGGVTATGDGGAGGKCVVQTCTMPPGLLGGGSSVVVEACAVPPTLTNLNNRGALAGCDAK